MQRRQPATVYSNWSGTSNEAYFGIWWKPSANWIGSENHYTKIFIIETTADNIYMALAGASPPFDVHRISNSRRTTVSYL